MCVQIPRANVISMNHGHCWELGGVTEGERGNCLIWPLTSPASARHVGLGILLPGALQDSEDGGQGSEGSAGPGVCAGSRPPSQSRQPGLEFGTARSAQPCPADAPGPAQLQVAGWGASGGPANPQRCGPDGQVTALSLCPQGLA